MSSTADVIAGALGIFVAVASIWSHIQRARLRLRLMDGDPRPDFVRVRREWLC